MAEVEISAMTFGPSGIGRIGAKTAMVPGCVPGDLLEVGVESERRGYIIARIERVIRPGPSRRIPPCPYLPRCGGCDWQQIEYAAQVRFKGQAIARELARVPGLEHLAANGAGLVQAAPAEFGYRARLRFKVGADGVVGFHEAGSRRLVPIDHCMVGDAALKTPVEFARALRCGEIEVVASGARQVVVAHLLKPARRGEIDRANRIVNDDPAVAGAILKCGRDRIVLGDASVPVRLEAGLELEADADQFSQVNRAQNQRLVAAVMEMAAPAAGVNVLDLFGGAGNFSLPAARRGAVVTGADAEAAAIEAARRNALRLGFERAQFVAIKAAEMAKFLTRARSRPDAVILDPPRDGAPELIGALAAMRPGRVIYVSCDAATLARDLRGLVEAGYWIDRTGAFDFFPNTHHAEIVVRAVLTSIRGRS